ncbi:hypothetical protein AB3S75_034835 [Citrus x aurantiifolia]
MNFNIGSSSQHLLYSSSSSNSDVENDDDVNLINDIEAINVHEEAIISMTSNNNICMVYYLNQLNNKVIHNGSVTGHLIINRDREMASRNLFNDYFSKHPRFNDSIFCRRFRMSRSLFNCITNAVQGHDNYFMQRRDGVGRLGLSGLQKIIVVFRMLAYGRPIDASDEYIKIGESTTIESLKRFYHTIVEVFVEQYLRSPNTNDAARLLHVRKECGFSGVLGSLDYMQWK